MVTFAFRNGPPLWLLRKVLCSLQTVREMRILHSPQMVREMHTLYCPQTIYKVAYTVFKTLIRSTLRRYCEEDVS